MGVTKRVWGALGAALSGAGVVLGRELFEAIGSRPSGASLERVRRSPQYADGVFHNPSSARPANPAGMGAAVQRFLANRSLMRPSGEVPLVRTVQLPSDSGVFVTWYGHASALVELDGRRILLDPVWSLRASPSQLVGPKRVHPVPVEIEDLPRLDVVVVSHDHYDHLDTGSIRRLVATQDVPFVVPLGVGAHLEHWGVPSERVTELDWHESVDIAGVRIVATPAQHFSGRGTTQNVTLWASWVLAGPERRAFYTGDTGSFEGWKDIGAEHGPFDVTLVQLGCYDVGWPDIHMTPAEGVQAHVDLRGRVLVPVHWGTFALAPHPWAEPAEQAVAESAAAGVRLVVPRPGERVDVLDPPDPTDWWSAVR